MKEKILYLIIGILIGAIIATIGFYFYNKNNTTPMPQMDGNRPQMMQDGGGKGGPKGNKNSNSNEVFNGEIPPEKPDGDFDGNGQTPPDMNNFETTENTSTLSSES